ncbi:Solute carrier family 25 member 39-like protein 1 [Colletotrichum chlorophyti]|uniref:Solute carrier family 25 member 39-like protein 1 n=1 Tax=Colletotrichum chlorophyti TaxID=708187 RepID=A0A1Q8RJ12_9PEZI|nr:Solute carrier family 25 member 39-like protein 1 [Colletotrichum chlorophyti]
MTTIHQASGGQDHDRYDAVDSFAKTRSLPSSGNSGGGRGDDDITASQKMISAMSGSLLTSLLVTPLDVVRIRWQSQTVTPPTVDFSKLAMTTDNLKAFNTSNLGVTACCREVFFMNNTSELCLAMPRAAEGVATAAAADCAVEEVERKTISSTMDGLRKIARNEGFTSLWRGLSPTLLMTIPGNIIYFTGYDWLRYNTKSPIAQKLDDDTAPLVAGSGARILAATAVSPIELFRTRMQASTGNSTTGHLANTFRGIKDMVNANGYTSLWRGLTLTLWRDVPFSGIYWWGYETIRGKLTDMRETRRGRTLDARGSRTQARRRSQSQENHAETMTDSFIAGAVSGGFASIITMPFDVGKTRTQVYRDSSRKAVGAKSMAAEEGSMMRLLWHIFKTEGIQGLWKGWIPRTLKVAPACAIMISSYEVGKRVFRGVNEKVRRDMD